VKLNNACPISSARLSRAVKPVRTRAVCGLRGAAHYTQTNSSFCAGQRSGAANGALLAVDVLAVTALGTLALEAVIAFGTLTPDAVVAPSTTVLRVATALTVPKATSLAPSPGHTGTLP
jgi:hypothetical protein